MQLEDSDKQDFNSWFISKLKGDRRYRVVCLGILKDNDESIQMQSWEKRRVYIAGILDTTGESSIGTKRWSRQTWRSRKGCGCVGIVGSACRNDFADEKWDLRQMTRNGIGLVARPFPDWLNMMMTIVCNEPQAISIYCRRDIALFLAIHT